MASAVALLKWQAHFVGLILLLLSFNECNRGQIMRELIPYLLDFLTDVILKFFMILRLSNDDTFKCALKS